MYPSWSKYSTGFCAFLCMLLSFSTRSTVYSLRKCYRCLLIKGPFLNKKRTHLQKVLGDDNVVVVQFAEDATKMGSNGGSSGSNYAVYEKILKEGILVGLRRYQFFGKIFYLSFCQFLPLSSLSNYNDTIDLSFWLRGRMIKNHMFHSFMLHFSKSVVNLNYFVKVF